MGTLFNLVIVVQVLSAIAIVGLVLLQHGKGADMGAAFGSGASGSLFGASGSSNFLSKSTALAAAIFFASTLGLSVLASKGTVSSSATGVMDNVKAPVQAPAPVSGSAAIPSAAPAPAPAPAAATPAPVETPAASAAASAASAASAAK